MKWTDEQIKHLEENYGKTPTSKIAGRLGTTEDSVSSKARRMGFKSNLKRRHTERLKHYPQKLKEMGMEPLDEWNRADQKTRFKCRYCGNIFITAPRYITSGHTKSCGCVGNRKGEEYISMSMFNAIKHRARGSNLEFSISISDLETLIKKQGFWCALSGVKITSGYGKQSQYTASVDRIDNNVGYILSNIQFVHKDVNMAKRIMIEEDFIKMCKEVAECNK